MPVAANVVINNGDATPVAHTFSPVDREMSGVLNFEQTIPAPANSLVAIKFGYKFVRQYNRMTKNLKTSTKVSTLMTFPKGETLGTNDNGFLPPPTLAYADTVRTEYILHDRGLAADRKNLRVLNANLQISAPMIASVDALQAIFGA